MVSHALMAKRRNTFVALPLLMTMAACDKYDGTQYLKVTALKPTIESTATQNFPRGNWLLEAVDSSDPAAVRSRGTGGACMLQLMQDLDGKKHFCSKAAECAEPGVTAPWEYYCLDHGSAGDTSALQRGQCWIHGPARWCSRTQDHSFPSGPTRWEVGTHNSYYSWVDVPAGSHWRVIACVNEYDPATKQDHVGCKQEHSQIDVGPVLTMP